MDSSYSSTEVETKAKRVRRGSLIQRNGRLVKQCSRCLVFKSPDRFYKRNGRTSGLMSRCRDCLKTLEKEARQRNASIAPLDPDTLRVCVDCELPLALSLFHRRRERKQGYDYHCKACHLKRQRNWRAKHPEKSPAYNFRYKIKRKVGEARRESHVRGLCGHHDEVLFTAKCDLWGWCCYLCGMALSLKTLEMEHRKPFAKNGSNWAANIAPACHACNQIKKARSDVDYRTSEGVVRRPIPSPIKQLPM